MAETVETAVYRLRVEGQEQVDRATRSVEGLATAEDKLASANRTTSASMQRSIAQLDPLIAAQERYLKALRSVENARERGVSESQLATRLELEKKAYDAATVAAEHYRRAQANAQLTPFKSAQDSAMVFEAEGAKKYQQALAGVASATKLSRYELINLSRQAQDVGVSLFSGQGFFTVLVQQGSQIFDVFASSKATVGEFFSSAVSWAGKFLTPMNMAIGAVVSFGAAAIYSAAQFVSAQKDIEIALIGIGRQSGATAEKINAFARIGPQQSITGMSPGEGREAGTQFARAGVDVSKIEGLKDAIRGYAIIAGTDAAEATKVLAKALGGDLVKAVDDLEKVYGYLDPSLRDTVRSLLLVNDAAGAQQAIIRALAEQNKELLDTITPLEAGWKGLKVAYNMWAEGMMNILAFKVFETDAQKAAAAAKRVADELKGVRDQQEKLIGKGMKVIEDQTPEIAQIDKLKQQLVDLKAAKEAAAAAGNDLTGYEETRQKLENQKRLITESKVETVRHNQEVAKLAQQYGNVSLKTQEILFSLQNQLPVIQAVTGQERIAAEYAAEYARLKREGVEATEAQRIASEKRAASEAAATTSVMQQVEALKDSNAMITANQNGTEATTAAAIAYKNAIKSGADSTAAAALSAETLKNHLLQAGQYVMSMDEHAQSMMASLNNFQAGMGQSLLSAQTAAGGGYDSSGAAQSNGFSANPMNFAPTVMTGSYSSQVTASTRAKAGQGFLQPLIAAAIQKEAEQSGWGTGWAAPSWKAADKTDKLTDSIVDLKDSTDKLTKSNEDLLSPYYTQDPRTSHIGFRSQGMASGGYVDVPGGVSSNDNMIATIPVASGERIYIDPMTNRRGSGGGGGGMVINISSPINIYGNADKDQFGRTVYQNNQQLAKQVRAATQ